MKAFFLGLFKVVFFLSILLWLCATFTDELTAFFEFLPVLFFGLLLAAAILVPILSFLACLLSSQPPASIRSPNPAPPTPLASPPLPVRQRDTLTPFLLGLALGWWLDSDPWEGGDNCEPGLP